ncbi:MAG: DUF1934 domain-containing protein [Lachnospiraceae bacterium]|nr:DUF1934 domain-containing protein [Lachnospiraceae bacterium]
MNKDVLISIKGMYFEQDISADDIEVIQAGKYYNRNGFHYVCYEEPLEGSTDVISNMLKFNDTSLTVSKKGPINTSLNFTLDEKSLNNYNTPFGVLTLGVDTSSITIKEKQNNLLLNVEYSLDVNYQFVSKCNISIDIKDKV